MKKTPKAGAGRPSRVAEMRAEYAFSGGERGKYAKRLGPGGTMVVLDPDVAAAIESASLGTAAEVHTGFWGCGAFGGNRELMVLLQLLAASAAGVSQVVMHVMDDDGLALGARVRERVMAMPQAMSRDELVDWVAGLGLRWGVGNGT